MQLMDKVASWPCDYASAQKVTFKVAEAVTAEPPDAVPHTKMLVAAGTLEPAQVQDLGDIIPKLLEIKTKSNTPIRFHLRIELGDGIALPPAEAAQKVNALLKNIKDDMQLK